MRRIREYPGSSFFIQNIKMTLFADILYSVLDKISPPKWAYKDQLILVV